MFIRASSQKDKKTRCTYTTYRLVESYRNQDGKVRQHTLLNLGCHFNIEKNNWHVLSTRIEEICTGQDTLFTLDIALEKEAARIAKLVSKNASLRQANATDKSAKSTVADYQTVDINTLSYTDIRSIGAEHVCHHAAKQLKLDELLGKLGFNQKQVNLALGTIIGRLVRPGSELSTHNYLREQSALDELLETDFSQLSLKNLYTIADKLYSHKSSIEDYLYSREKDLFNLEEIVTLYDITNTYMQGRCQGNSKAKYGRSKEKRSDRRLISLGMVLDVSGFPKSSKIFPGNVSEAGTLEEMLTALKVTDKATIVMDAGIATEENINWLKASGYEYIVVSRKRNLVMPEEGSTVIVKQDKNNLVEASLVENKDTDELELYCLSTAKQEKTNYMLTKAEERYETELHKLQNGLGKKGCTNKYEKILERLGRLKEKHKRISKYYQVTVNHDEAKELATSIVFQHSRDESNTPGVYCLRTNKKNLDEKTFWQTYTMLTELEAAFRCLKSELGFRPVYHQKESRIDAHLFISIIAYHLLHTIRYQLKIKNCNYSWETLRNLLNTQSRITSTIKTQNNQSIRIRKTSSTNPNQIAIYNLLGIVNKL